MLCKQCNQSIPDDSNYCPNCGAHYPSIKKDKPSFDLEFIKKAFGISKQKSESETKSIETNSKVITQKKKFRFGWGWFVVGGIMSQGLIKYYGGHTTQDNLLYIIGIVLSILIYIYFRNKVLTEITSDLTRAFVAGIISIILAWIVVAITAGLIKPDVISDLNDKIVAENNKTKILLTEFQQKDKLLWEFYTDEPSTDSELKNNIKIIDKAIPFYHSKDSSVMAVYQKMHSLFEDAEKNYPDKFKFSSSMSEIILSLINHTKIYSSASQYKFNSLKAYYISVLNDDDAQDEVYNAYVDSESELSTAEQNFMEVQNQFQEACKKIEQ